MPGCTHEFATVGLLLLRRLLQKCIYFNEKPNAMKGFVLKCRDTEELVKEESHE